MKIYDCFTFNNELDLLEIRLNELNKYVDYFVIVEATKTHTGKKKELNYLKNKKRYSSFKKKIIHIILNDMPSIKKNNTWNLENYQREQILRGLKKCNPQDIIILSDVDEIPNLKKIKFTDIITTKNLFAAKLFKLSKILNYADLFLLKNTKKYFSLKKLYEIIVTKLFVNKSTWLVLEQNMYMYYLNGYSRKWKGTVIINYFNFKNIFSKNAQILRNVKDSGKIIKNGGWHFTYQGSYKNIKHKLNSFAHQEYNTKEYNQTNKLLIKIEKGINFIDNTKIIYRPINNTYPKYLIRNSKKYKKLIKQK